MEKENILDMKVDVDTSLVTEKLQEIEMTVDRITEKIGYLLLQIDSLYIRLNKMEWIPCDKAMPDSDKPCLVTYREFDIFKGDYGDEEIKILSFVPKYSFWNTKADIIVTAWMYLPEPYKS